MFEARFFDFKACFFVFEARFFVFKARFFVFEACVFVFLLPCLLLLAVADTGQCISGTVPQLLVLYPQSTGTVPSRPHEDRPPRIVLTCCHTETEVKG